MSHTYNVEKKRYSPKFLGDLNSCHFKPQSIIFHSNPNYKNRFLPQGYCYFNPERQSISTVS